METFSKEIPCLIGLKLLVIDVNKGKNGVKAKKCWDEIIFQAFNSRQWDFIFPKKNFPSIVETAALCALLKQEFERG